MGGHCPLSRCELAWDVLISSVSPGRRAIAPGTPVTGVVEEGLWGRQADPWRDGWHQGLAAGLRPAQQHGTGQASEGLGRRGQAPSQTPWSQLAAKGSGMGDSGTAGREGDGVPREMATALHAD